jgi:hypothetical protein
MFEDCCCHCCSCLPDQCAADRVCRCLLAKTYNAAEQLLEEDILDVDPSRTSCTPTDLYLYSLYGSMICIGVVATGKLQRGIIMLALPVLAEDVTYCCVASPRTAQVASSGHVLWSSYCWHWELPAMCRMPLCWPATRSLY